MHLNLTLVYSEGPSESSHTFIFSKKMEIGGGVRGYCRVSWWQGKPVDVLVSVRVAMKQ
jgi:hypothetical protein